MCVRALCVCVCVCVKFCFKLCEKYVETKMQSSQWMGKGSPLQTKTRVSRSKIKVMFVVFFIGKALSIMNLYHVVIWQTNSITRKF